MKIFSSFDTSFRKEMIQDKIDRYGKDMTHVIRKSKFFLLEYIILPLLLMLMVVGGGGFVLYYYLDPDIIIIILSMSVVFVGGLLYYSVIKRLIDYYMDYCIITPDEVILAEQQGLFKRQIRSLDAMKIKSINIKKKNFINSVFNNGSIVFMSDGDETNGEIVLEYVYHPEEHKNILSNIIKPQ